MVSADLEDQGENKCYHEAKISPLVQKIPVDINTIGLTEVFTNERAD